MDCIEGLLGPNARANDYDPTGYNSEGGGPVNAGTGLTCDFDGHPCCWANVPPPDDQLEWQMGNGELDAPRIQRHFGPFGDVSKSPPLPKGNFLIAWARSAGPSDEAQFASCSIACASGPITVKARYKTIINWLSVYLLLSFFQALAIGKRFASSMSTRVVPKFGELQSIAQLSRVSALGQSRTDQCGSAQSVARRCQ
jgi:hypothetical protein